MANKSFIVSPLFDRLMDDQPDQTSEVHVGQTLEQMKRSIVEELMHLFNTRRSLNATEDEAEGTYQSLLQYGLPDLASINPKDPDECQHLCREMERLIALFEQRLTDVHVSHVTQDSTKGNSLSFRIEATINLDPDPAPLVLNTKLETSTWRFSKE